VGERRLHQVARPFGTQAIGGIGPLAQLPVPQWKFGQLVEQDLRARGRDRSIDRRAVDRVADHGRGSLGLDGGRLVGRPRHAGHIVAVTQERRHEGPAEGARGAGDENPHRPLLSPTSQPAETSVFGTSDRHRRRRQ
jgi:hypothetical protein